MALFVHLSRHQVDGVVLHAAADEVHPGEGEPVHVVVHKNGLLRLKQCVGTVPVDVDHLLTGYWLWRGYEYD